MNPAGSSVGLSPRPCGPAWTRGLLALALVCAAVPLTPVHAEPLSPVREPEPATPPPLPGGLERWEDGLALLHAGRTEEALDWFGERARRRPDDPCASYFYALIHFNFDIGGLLRHEQEARGRRRLDPAIEFVQDLVDDGEADPGARYCLGAMYGVRASARLLQDKYFGAAFDAKRARAVMLDLLDDEPECIDCRFWIGSYDYFADVLPGVVKFFRSVLFFPSGDRERGIANLQEVAREGRLDRYNALWILYSLYRGLERDPAQAYEVLERLRADYPECLDTRLMLAWHHALHAEPPDRPRAVALHLEALETARRVDGKAGARMTLQVKVSLARLHLNDLRPEAAIELLWPVLRSVRGDPEREIRVANPLISALNRAGRHADAQRLLEGVAARHPDAPELKPLEQEVRSFDAGSSRVLGAVIPAWRMGREGDLGEAQARFRDLLAMDEAGGLVHYGMAGMYFDLERSHAAETHYRAAVADGIDGPPHYLPLAYLRIGHALDLRGERGGAKSFYRKAAGAAGDSGWLRREAKHYLKQPYRGPERVPVR